MPITYGVNLAKSWGAERVLDRILMKSYAPHTARSDVFLSYQRSDEGPAMALARALHEFGRDVFIDILDDTLIPGDRDLDTALMTAIGNSETMVIIVSDNTQLSWWVPWEIGVLTPSGKPRAMYKPTTSKPLPSFLEKLTRFQNAIEVNQWVLNGRRRY